MYIHIKIFAMSVLNNYKVFSFCSFLLFYNFERDHFLEIDYLCCLWPFVKRMKSNRISFSALLQSVLLH